MISCVEFIPAYSVAFGHLEETKGKEAVIALWEYLSKHYLEDTLKKNVEEKGLEGCFDYWSKSLDEEKAEFTMTYDKEKEEFCIDMHKCPSKSILLDLMYLHPYPDYCQHCDVLYRKVLEPLGYEYEYDMSQTNEAKCKLVVRKKGGKENG